jgi:type I restriction enzyme M protein
MTTEEFKAELWRMANSLRGSVSAAQYKYPVLGLTFLKYVSDMFEAQGDFIRDELKNPESELFIEDEELRLDAGAAFTEDKTFYDKDNVFWVPEEARFSVLLSKASSSNIAQLLDDAMASIEKDNPRLKGVLYRDFGRLELGPGKLGELMTTVARIKFDPQTHGSKDIFGEVYEYFLGKFAMSEGQRAGEFYTPKSVVTLIVEILAPFKGKIYDPACGSGGMFVQSNRFKEAHAKKAGDVGDLAIYGQEYMAATRKLCLMNLAVHGLEGDIGKTYGSTFTEDQHSKLRADYILANPPFNISDWEGNALKDDPRWIYGVPPAGNANYAWLQHMLSRLSQKGRAGIVLANGSLTTQSSGEGAIRKAMILGDQVECILALPPKLFSNVTIPACIWFLSKDKTEGGNGSINRNGEVLFLDCSNLETENISKTQVVFQDETIEKISQTYHRWRGTEFADSKEYVDELGFCKSATHSD